MGQCTGDKACPVVADILRDTCDLIPLHKRFLAQMRLGEIELLNGNFHRAKDSTAAFSMGIVRGRIPEHGAIL